MSVVRSGTLAALSVIAAARHQQESMRVAIGERSKAANLSPIIDENRFVQCQVRSGRNKSIQVHHRSVLPQKRVLDQVGACGKEVSVVKPRSTYNLARRIDRICNTARIAGQGSEVRNHAIFPEECE